MTMGLKDSLLGLAGQVLAGRYDDHDEEYLRNQVMRLYRGAEFAPPAGQVLALSPGPLVEGRELAPDEVLAEWTPRATPLEPGESVAITPPRRGRRKEP